MKSSLYGPADGRSWCWVCDDLRGLLVFSRLGAGARTRLSANQEIVNKQEPFF